MTKLLLRVAERSLTVTLAEPGYARLFSLRHPVLPNYPLVTRWPHLSELGEDVVYVGDVTELRGALFAVEAVAAMRKPRRLWLVGSCEPDLRARIRTLADRLGVRVELPGYLAHDEALIIIARATVGICPLADVPNYRDSLPTKTLEYLSLGVPVLASDLPGTTSVLAGRTGVRLVPARDVTAWVNGLEELIGDRAVRADTQLAAQSVRAEFEWPAGRLLDTYASVAPPLLDLDGPPITRSTGH